MQNNDNKPQMPEDSTGDSNNAINLAAIVSHTNIDGVKQKLPRVTHSGELNIGGMVIPAVVLDDGRRVLTQQGVLLTIGRSRSAKGGQGATSGTLPAFLVGKKLEPYVEEFFTNKNISTAPIKFRLFKGVAAYGYPAEILPVICNLYLKARDDKALHPRQKPIADVCDILIRGLATVGITALVDEATGYQEVRDKKALQEILSRYISGELLEWAKMFPDDFYKELFRLRGWQYRNMSVKRPGCVGQYTVDLIYRRLAPGVYTKLREVNPKNQNGKLAHHYHRWLTDAEGKPALDRHLHSVTTLMRASPNWDSFMRLMNRSLPRHSDNLLLPGLEWSNFNDEQE